VKVILGDDPPRDQKPHQLSFGAGPLGKTYFFYETSLGRALDPITQDACAFFEDHVVFDDFTGVAYETCEGERIAKALCNHKAAILRNHGLLTVGHTVDEAAWWFITMDRSCHAQLLASAAGKPVLITRECALATRQQVGTHETGWFQFQPLWEMITREQPDLLD
jgi:ribulose-5-phosphate 4-epimerase/fuculose-1-phosphate aldolase